jgi:DNA-binding NtrC family response regulator
MQELFEIIERVADTDTNVLITGESGIRDPDQGRM